MSAVAQFTGESKVDQARHSASQSVHFGNNVQEMSAETKQNGHRGSNVSVGDQWGEFMTDLSSDALGGGVRAQLANADQLDTIQHQWLNESGRDNCLTLPEVTKMMAGGELDNYGEMTSARARKWFDEYTAPPPRETTRFEMVFDECHFRRFALHQCVRPRRDRSEIQS